MTNQECSSAQTKLESWIKQGSLKPAFELIHTWNMEINDWKLKEQLEEVENTYKLMLSYILDAIEDPQRATIYQSILCKTYQIADNILMQIRIKDSFGFLGKQVKINLVHQNLQEKQKAIFALEEISEKIALNALLQDKDYSKQNTLELHREYETIRNNLFETIWLSSTWNEDEFAVFKKLFDQTLLSIPSHALLISAITLACYTCFDTKKIILLLEKAEHKDEEIRLRAITGLLLCLRKYDQRIYLFPEIQDRLQHLCENRAFVSAVQNICLQFILSKDTEKITKKITEEIIPEMMKVNPVLNQKIKLEDLTNETGIEDKNPDWKNIIEDSGLSEKLQEFSELQLQGADVMHSSFSQLKTHHFFNNISHWFLPFDIKNSYLSGLFGEKDKQSVLVKLLESNMLCNSDKYSFCFSLMQVPESYREMMTGQFGGETEGLLEMQSSELPNPHQKAINISKQYIQDLYRFYKLHPEKINFNDPFNEKKDFVQVDSIANIIANEESLEIIAESYFAKNYFYEATEVFSKLIEINKDKAILYQKRGFCLQMNKKTAAALEDYLKADLLEIGNSWVYKKIAYCYRLLKNPKDALHFYNKADLMSPNNSAVQMNIGHCQLELKNYPEALKSYFKVEYLDTNGSRSWRPIAWCSFLVGKQEQAQTYFEKVIDLNPEFTDFLNYGHSLLACKKNREALEAYKKSIKLADQSMEKFMLAFNSDIPELIKAGICQKDIPFILDALKYKK
ncbi:hypothetical protein AwDysgo_03660 [Bacteroidales bacterium]|nr:hypothetical protein AwDysgo_03660 [Bacteroidales bacterium]